MTRSDWVGVFWFGVVISVFASMLMAGVIGYWWKDVAGATIGVAFVVLLSGVILAYVGFRYGFRQFRRSNE